MESAQKNTRRRPSLLEALLMISSALIIPLKTNGFLFKKVDHSIPAILLQSLQASIEAPCTKCSALCVCEFLCEQLIYVAFLRLVLGFDFRSFHSSNLTIKFSNSKAVMFDSSNKSHPSNTLDKG